MPNKDFVSRQWLIDEYHRRHQGPPDGALTMIEEAPAADVEPVRHGRWILVQWVKDEDWQEGGYWILRCSECVMPNYNTTPYCPHCGAKMLPEPPKEEEDHDK